MKRWGSGARVSWAEAESWLEAEPEAVPPVEPEADPEAVPAFEAEAVPAGRPEAATAASSAAQVMGPQIPSTVSPLAVWNFFTSRMVMFPYFPSAP